MSKKKANGEITIFLSLILSLLISLIMSLFQSAIIFSSEAVSREISRIALKSTFSEYNKDCFDKYDIFLLDATYEKAYNDKNITERFKNYVNLHTDTYENSRFSSIGSFINLSLNNVSIESLNLATDDNGSQIFNQAINSIKSKYGIGLINSFTNFDNLLKNITNNENTYKETKNNNNNELSSIDSTLKEQGIEKDIEKESESPLASLSKFKSKDILDLIVGSSFNISNKEISFIPPSQRNNLSGFGTIISNDCAEIYDKFIFIEYLFDHLSYASNELNNNALSYEIEYLISGKLNDRENLKTTLNKISLIYEATNFAYLLSSPSKINEALVLATSLVGYLGFPPLVEATKYALLLGWAYGETIIDLRLLLQGKKVALFKNDSNFRLSLSNLTTLSTDNSEEDPNGISYKDALKIILNLESKDKLSSKFLDIIEANIKLTGNNPNFQLDYCATAIKFHTIYSINHFIEYDYPIYYNYR